MTDPIRELAEGFAFYANKITHEEYALDMEMSSIMAIADHVERILREHHEGLAERLCETLFEGCASDNPWELLQIRRALEGGRQDAMPQDRASNQGPADLARAAAPDQPHEFSGRNRECCLKMLWFNGQAARCNRPADDPIHDVRNSRTENEDGVYVTAGDEVRWLFESGVAFAGKVLCADPAWPQRKVFMVFSNNEQRAHSLSVAQLRTPDGRPVLGFDPNEAEVARHDLAIARDRIAELERELAQCRRSFDSWRKSYDRVCEEYGIEGNLREHLNRLERERDEMVSAFKEAAEWNSATPLEAALHVKNLVLNLRADVAVAERERDEARAERDAAEDRGFRAAGELMQGEQWVRLTDDDIERIQDEIDASILSMGRGGSWMNTLASVLRDYRDGKLGGER